MTRIWAWTGLALSMKQAKNVREELVRIRERYPQSIVLCDCETDRVRRALCTGFFHNASRRDTEAGAGAGCYKTVVQGTQVYLHPLSALFGKQAEWVMNHEFILTSSEYTHWTTSVEPNGSSSRRQSSLHWRGQMERC